MFVIIRKRTRVARIWVVGYPYNHVGLWERGGVGCAAAGGEEAFSCVLPLTAVRCSTRAEETNDFS